MRVFTINGKQYNAKEFDFNLICEFEDLGMGLGDIAKHNTAVRGYLAMCGNMTVEQAGAEINAHILAGNDLTEISEVFSDMLDKSDFFKELLRQIAEKVAKKEENQQTLEKKK